MSQTITLANQLDVDSRLTVASEKSVKIYRGALANTTNFTTPSTYSNSNLNFNVQLSNSREVLIDPYCFVSVPIQVTVTASGLTGTLVEDYVKDNFALRQYPISSVTNTLTVQINNQQVTSQPYQYIHQLSQYQWDFADEANRQSICPIMPDMSQQYSDLVGSGKSPLLSYESGTDAYDDPRGSFNSFFTTVTGTTGQWVFNTTVREPLMNPLMCYSPSYQREGLAYVNLMTVQYNFLSNLSRMFSLDADTCPLITNISVNIQPGAQLVQQFLTKPMFMHLPPVVIRSFNTLVCNSTIQQSFSSNETRSIQSTAYNINQIPRKFWLYINDSQTDNSSGYEKTDTCFAINSVSITWNNITGILSNTDAASLYNSCHAEEGGLMTFVQQQKFVGSVLCIDPAKLMNLKDDEAPSVQGTYNLQISVNCTNISDHAITPNMWVVWGLDTILTTTDAFQSNLVQGFVTPNQILEANKLPAVPSSFITHDVYGGAFKDWLKRAWSFIKDNKIISKALPYVATAIGQPELAPFASKAAEALGVARTNKRGMIKGRARALRY